MLCTTPPASVSKNMTRTSVSKAGVSIKESVVTGARCPAPGIHQDLLDYRVHTTNTIKAEGKGAVVQELIQMHLDLLAELRISLETDALLRKRVLNYLKVALNNYTDMRAELLVLSFARLLTKDCNPTDKLREFPEIAEPSTHAAIIQESGVQELQESEGQSLRYQDTLDGCFELTARARSSLFARWLRHF